MLNKKTVVIGGAGCAGLAAGIALQKRGFQVTILEQAGRIGGLAGGIDINNNMYEYGPHIFHTTDPEIMADVKRIAGHVLLPFKKIIKIKFLNKYFDFPLSISDIFLKLPPPVILAATASFLKCYIRGFFRKKSAFKNSEMVLQHYYGDVLYKIFFKDYIIKVWGIEPKEMSPSFAQQRIPRFNLLNFVDKIKKAVFDKRQSRVSTDDYIERVEGEHYTTSKGFSSIIEAFAEEFKRYGGILKLRSDIRKINIADNKCCSVEFNDSQAPHQNLSCDFFISTMPINILPGIMNPSPSDEMRKAASNLHFRAITFVGLLVRKTPILPASFMYFRDKSFNRITDLGHFKVKITPEGHSILVAEITCSPGDVYWEDEEKTKNTVIEELCNEGLVERDEIVECHIFKARHGYPIYTLGYEKALETLLKGLEKYQNIYTIGRQGKFAYINTHVAMKMGYEVARKMQSENV